MFQVRGGGAALSVATVHKPLSGTIGNSAFCTVPLRDNSVTDAGWGRFASVVDADALSGRMTNARFGESATTSKSGPALWSQLLTWSAVAESATPAGFTVAESTGGGDFARSQATSVTDITSAKVRRN